MDDDRLNLMLRWRVGKLSDEELVDIAGIGISHLQKLLARSPFRDHIVGGGRGSKGRRRISPDCRNALVVVGAISAAGVIVETASAIVTALWGRLPENRILDYAPPGDGIASAMVAAPEADFSAADLVPESVLVHEDNLWTEGEPTKGYAWDERLLIVDGRLIFWRISEPRLIELRDRLTSGGSVPSAVRPIWLPAAWIQADGGIVALHHRAMPEEERNRLDAMRINASVSIEINMTRALRVAKRRFYGDQADSFVAPKPQGPGRKTASFAHLPLGTEDIDDSG